MEEVPAEYALNVLWLDKSIGLAVDQCFKGVRLSPSSLWALLLRELFLQLRERDMYGCNGG